MKKLLSLLLCAALALSLAPHVSKADGVVNVFNWEDYIDPAAIELFTEETGIQVNYMRFTTNEDMLVQERMVFTVEPAIFIPGLGGFRHSDTAIVTADGNRITTDHPNDLASMTL